MARVDTVENFLSDIATSMRNASGESKQYQASAMDAEILRIVHEHSGDPNKKVYKVKTTQEMNQLTGMVEDDLCLMYDDSYEQLVIPTSANTVYYFPKNVTLPSAITSEDSYAVGTTYNKWTYTINASSFTVKQKGFSTLTKMAYTSNDGIHYTRTTNANTLNITQGINEDKSWMHYFLFPNRVNIFKAVYQYSPINSWKEVVYDDNLLAKNIKGGVTILGVEGIYGGTVSIVPKDVNYYDYDGTLVYSYTKEEYANISTHPANPEHEGLVAQGWNLTVSTIKTRLNAAGFCSVGQYYVTDTGATRLYISVPDNPFLMDIQLCIGAQKTDGTSGGTVKIEWGDHGVTWYTVTSDSYIDHKYSAPGNYVISIIPQNNETLWLGKWSGSNGTGLLQNKNFTGVHLGTASMITKVELGSKTYLRSGAFHSCRNLKSISVSSGSYLTNSATAYQGKNTFYNTGIKFIVHTGNLLGPSMYQGSCIEDISFTSSLNNTAVSQYAFYESKIKRLHYVITSDVTELPYNFANRCHHLEKIFIPNTITSFGTNALSECSLLSVLKVPSGVTTLSTSSFLNAYGLQYSSLILLDFSSSTQVVELTGTDLVQYLSTLCKIVVPDALYDEWVAASIWCDNTSKIVKASEYFV